MFIERLDRRLILAAGGADLAFSGDGFQTVSFAGTNGAAEALDVAVASDGTVVLGGYATISGVRSGAIAKLSSDGTLLSTQLIAPATLGSTLGLTVRSVVVQSDGKPVLLVATGSTESTRGGFLVRLTTGGAFDPTFDGDGILATPGGDVREIALDSQQRIVLVGNTTGGSFGGVSIPPQGYVERFMPGGAADSTFGGGTGSVLTGAALPLSVAVASGDALFISGTAVPQFQSSFGFVSKYTAAGLFDPLFAGGAGSFPFAAVSVDDVEVAANTGDVILGMNSLNPATPALDTSRIVQPSLLDGQSAFGAPVGSRLAELALEADGRTYVVSSINSSPYAKVNVVRLLADQTPDFAFGTGGQTTISYLPALGTAVSKAYATTRVGGRLYVVGSVSSTPSSIPTFAIGALTTVPIAAPVVTASSFRFETRHAFTFTFDVAIQPTTVDVGDIVVRSEPSGLPISLGGMTASYDAATRTATYTLATPIATDGSYQVDLQPNAVQSMAGGTNLATSLAFSVLGGDADRNRSVGFSDLLTLAKNYGQSGRTFSQGNFDYSADGVVGFTDLLILAKRYGTTLPSAGALPASRRRRETASLADAI